MSGRTGARLSLLLVLGLLLIPLIGCGGKKRRPLPAPVKNHPSSSTVQGSQRSDETGTRNGGGRAANRSDASAGGKTGTARAASAGMKGLASWYGKDYHGRKTASGEKFNMFDYTAAHRTLPFDTVLRVENTDNGLTVVVRINDRGPFKDDRIIDLSYAAAKKIDLVVKGVVPVRLILLSTEEEEEKTKP